MKESYIEKESVKYAKTKGYISFKIEFIGQKGAPDRLFIKKDNLFFVEFKNNKGVISEMQKHQQKILTDCNISVYNVFSIEEFKRIKYVK